VIILGIDPGSLTTGYGFIETSGNRLAMLDAGPIRLKSQGEIPQRLAFLGEQLVARIEACRPDALVVEKVFHGVNFNSTLRLGYVRGVILMIAAQQGLPIFEYAASEVKKTVTGYGRAEKTQVQEMVRILLNLRQVPKPHDVADALALAICHAHMGSVLQKYGGY